MSITDNLQENKYVAFLDVLGFKELVKGKGEKLNIYFETIKNALIDIQNDKAEIESQLVSDSTILACGLTKENLKLLLRAVQTIQARCAVENIWIRGAITIGDIHFDRKLNIVVGNGLTDAYLLEQEERFPRVIIDPKILREEFGFGTRKKFINTYNDSHLRKNSPLIHEPFRDSELIDSDAIFVAIAERIIFEVNDNLETVYKNIQSELYKSQHTHSKYLWLKRYFAEVLTGENNLHIGLQKAGLSQPSAYSRKVMEYQYKFSTL